MPKLTVNGNEVEFEQGMTVLQACEVAGEEIPRFCYHERLKIAGNCRMCLVQIEGGPPKPAASCAMPAGDGMVVHTNTPMVKKAREGVMEFTLINHPLDCPICDQGGECDLQDFAMVYGRGKTRYKEPKRAIKDKSYGPLVKPTMNRCIHCTRCIRFLTDVAGSDDLGGTGRGEDMEVGTFIEKNINSELSGNIIDLCPVGALTSKPYEFKCRSWELEHTDSIDVLDAVGSNIRVDNRGNEVVRVLPRLNEDVNEEWISDKTRFSYDGLKVQRLDTPYVRKGASLNKTSWEDAISAASSLLKKAKPAEIGAIVGDLADAESILLLKQLMDKIGTKHIDCRQDGQKVEAGNRSATRFNTTISGIEQADVCLIIGANPRFDASLINTRIRKSVLENDLEVAVIGDDCDLTYDVNYLGENTDIIDEILSGKHKFSAVLKKAKNPMVIIGDAALTRKDGAVILSKAQELAEKFDAIRDEWNGFNVLHTSASRVAGLELGFVPAKGGKDTDAIIAAAKKGDIKVLFLLGADEIDLSDVKAEVIYVGSHGDVGASAADVILPGSAYTEKEGTYLNTEGRLQRTRKAIFAPGEAREDWRVINDLLRSCGADKSYDGNSQVRSALIEASDAFAQLDAIAPAKWEIASAKGKLLKEAIADSAQNFYMTDPISRASQNMANCTGSFVLTQGKDEAA